MKVKDLIELLETFSPDSNVFIMAQPNYPFEHSIAGVTNRREFEETDDDSDGVNDDPDAHLYNDGKSRSDVFLCEGSQIRYGARSAFDACRR